MRISSFCLIFPSDSSIFSIFVGGYKNAAMAQIREENQKASLISKEKVSEESLCWGPFSDKTQEAPHINVLNINFCCMQPPGKTQTSLISGSMLVWLSFYPLREEKERKLEMLL